MPLPMRTIQVKLVGRCGSMKVSEAEMSRISPSILLIYAISVPETNVEEVRMVAASRFERK